MIRTGELRIGNKIIGIYEDYDDNESSEIVEVVCIDPTKEITEYEIWVDGSKESYDDFAPIPLTEEWLIKLGFECEDKVNGGYTIEINNNLKKKFYCSKNGTVALVEDLIKYNDFIIGTFRHVHQLQNLFFALTNKELKEINK